MDAKRLRGVFEQLFLNQYEEIEQKSSQKYFHFQEMTGAVGLSPRACDGRLRHSRDQEDPLLLTPPHIIMTMISIIIIMRVRMRLLGMKSCHIVLGFALT